MAVYVNIHFLNFKSLACNSSFPPFAVGRSRMEDQLTSKKATIDDIARLANVSKSTVSRVLNDTTPVNPAKRIAVEAAMKELNFQPNVFARSLAGGQSKTIGVLTQHLGSPFHDSISQGVISYLSGTSYWPLFADGNDNPETAKAAIENLLVRRIDGLIFIGGMLSEEALIEFHDRVPTFAVGFEMKTVADRSIGVDNEQAAFNATNHLIELGHRRIVHITGIANHNDSVRRLEGYRRALTESGIEIDPELICQGEFDGQSGFDAVTSLLENGKKFTAVFAANDVCAMGATLALDRKSLSVPEDVSVIGFDDQAEASFSLPPLTTVRQPATEMGVVAAIAIVAMINKKPFKLPRLPAEVTVRESTAKVKI